MSDESVNDRIFVIERVFDAPRDRVFGAFASADALNAWWGPVECNNSVVSLDFRPGGIFHFSMEFEGHVNYGRFLYTRIEPDSLLEFSNAFADENGNVIKAPFEVPLPDEILYTFVFEELEGKTKMTMTGRPLKGTEEEAQGFVSITEDMQRGFGSSFDKLVSYLS